MGVTESSTRIDLKVQVDEGITIVATIHCPPPHTFKLFDRAFILQQGSIVYFGLNGSHATNYFHSHFEKVRLGCRLVAGT